MQIIRKFIGILFIAFIASASFAFAQVATIFELTGTANATAGTAPGAPVASARTLRKGDRVNQGDSVKTGESSALVLRFDDGQIVALTSNSNMKIDNYTYNRAEPAKSNVLFSLLQGGMRAVTGLIGKAKPEQVAYRAGSATIGIRGTDITVSTSGGNLVITVIQGEISFQLQGKTTTVKAGEGVDARSDGTVRKAAIAALIASLSPEMAAIFTELDKKILDSLIKRAGAVDLANNPAAPATGSTGTTGASGSGGGSTPCTSVSPVNIPAGCTPPTK